MRDAERVRALERACLMAWPAATQHTIFGWEHCASSGKSGRINAVWPLEWSDENYLEEAVAQASIWCRRHGVAPCFKLAEGGVQPAHLPEVLHAYGFAPGTETLVMTLPLHGQAEREPPHSGARNEGRSDPRLSAAARPANLTLLNAPTEEIWSPLRESSPSAEDFAERRGVVERIAAPRIFAVASLEGKPAAIGMGVRTDDLIGLYLMRTAPWARRRGLARDLVGGLLHWGGANGARTAYLQVEASNAPAIALYGDWGFAISYRYHYWRLAE